MVDQETWENTVLQKLELPNGVIASNRIMRAATWMGQAEEDGIIGNTIIETYSKIRAGVVVTGFQYVMYEGQSIRRMVSNSKPSDVEGLKRLAGIIHSSGSLAAAQLVHCGSTSLPKYSGNDVYGPSDMEFPDPKGDTVQVKAMTVNHVEEVTQAYADAAKRAVEAGFDVIELHGAHNYGLWQFFDPTYNKRPVNDPYTGSTIEGRCKAMVDAVRAVKSAVDVPIQVKVDSSSKTVRPEEVGELTKKLAEAGAYCVIFSGPNPTQSPKDAGEAYFLDDAMVIRSIAHDSGLLFGLVGGIRSPETVVKLLTGDGNSAAAFDVIQLSRPLISEPALVHRWTEEAKVGKQEPARCISCNRCFGAGFKGKVQCVQFEGE
ncbi:MAG: NADH oxidase [Candidatus Thorarchaeota archaeon AB_25]|nr:MAG: NADH oxidase [Candidatus Thorarchaeota archaeon AB_25]